MTIYEKFDVPNHQHRPGRPEQPAAFAAAVRELAVVRRAVLGAHEPRARAGGADASYGLRNCVRGVHEPRASGIDLHFSRIENSGASELHSTEGLEVPGAIPDPFSRIEEP